MQSEKHPPPDPSLVLGVSPDASDEDIRAAYLRKVKQFPPDRNPEEFELVRDAYALMRDQRQRIRRRLISIDPRASIESALELGPAERKFVGPDPWLAVLKGK
jgi:preprotein translocase subunit Sec63